MEHVKLVIYLEDDAWHGYTAENIWVVPLGKNLYRIDNNPIWTKGISCEDIVNAEIEEDGRLTFKKIVKKSGNCTYRIIFDKDTKDISSYLNKFCEYGDFEHMSSDFDIYSFNINYKKVEPFYSLLSDLENKKILDFEEGDYYNPDTK